MYLNGIFRLAIFWKQKHTKIQNQKGSNKLITHSSVVIYFFFYLQVMEDCLFGQKAFHQVIM
jgi:hypothetical protein